MASEIPNSNDDHQLTTESVNEQEEIKLDNSAKDEVHDKKADINDERKENGKNVVSDGHANEIEDYNKNKEKIYNGTSTDGEDDRPFQKTTKTDVKPKKKLSKVQLSDRLQYLSRPKKDYLDRFVDGRLDGAIPEETYPSWESAPLQTKIALGDCPIPLTSRKIGTKLFLATPGDDFDFQDENNLLLPSKCYSSLHDPNLKSHLRNKNTLQKLRNRKLVSDSERATCTLEDINTYRRYQRRILAVDARKTMRDKDEAFRRERARGMEEKMKRDAELCEAKRTQGVLRRKIKEAASVRDCSMEKQIIRDMKVLNCQIRRQKAQQERIGNVQEKYQRIFANHMDYKYGDHEKEKKKIKLAMAKADLELLDKLCKRQEEAKMQRIKKLDEFWKRKNNWQKEFLAEGKELDRKREIEKKNNIEILNRTGKLPVLFLNAKETAVRSTTGKNSQKCEISDEKTAKKQSDSESINLEQTDDKDERKDSMKPEQAGEEDVPAIDSPLAPSNESTVGDKTEKDKIESQHTGKQGESDESVEVSQKESSEVTRSGETSYEEKDVKETSGETESEDTSSPKVSGYDSEMEGLTKQGALKIDGTPDEASEKIADDKGHEKIKSSELSEKTASDKNKKSTPKSSKKKKKRAGNS